MNSERPVFIPFVYGLAAKLGQMPLSEMTSDASYYTHSLEDAYELFKYDGIVNTYDSTVEAEIFGCELEWPEDYRAPRVTDLLKSIKAFSLATCGSEVETRKVTLPLFVYLMALSNRLSSTCLSFLPSPTTVCGTAVNSL